MSTTFYIYEVPGHKAGATKNWKGRSRANFNKYSIEPILLETMEGPDTEEFWQVVGDREWELADQYNGYKRGEHYLNIRVRANHNNRTTSHFVRTGSNNSSPGAHKNGRLLKADQPLSAQENNIRVLIAVKLVEVVC